MAVRADNDWDHGQVHEIARDLRPRIRARDEMRIPRAGTHRPDDLLRSALKRANAYAARAMDSPTSVQLLGQVSASGDWPQIREYWTRRSGLTGSWPTRLAPNEMVLNLWPIAPGQLQRTTGVGAKPPRRQPRKLLGTPALLSFDAAQSAASSDDALARAIASWLDDVIAHDEYAGGFLLAPPLLEEWAPKGRLVRRRVVTFDLDWPLAAAEALAWPPALEH